MKSALYVAAVTKFYRQILDSRGGKGVTLADLETIFSRRTTELYLDGKGKESPIDPESLGHLGAPIGTVKRVTKDRDGRQMYCVVTDKNGRTLTSDTVTLTYKK